MKKLRILTTLLFGCFLFAGCNPANPEPEIIDDCIIPGDCANEEPNEEFVSYYDNGTIREIGTYVNGKKEGVWTTYDEGGNIINIEEYKNGELVEHEVVNDIMNDEKLLSLYPGIQINGWNIILGDTLQENDWNVILGDTLQTNYVNGTNNIYYDPYRGFAFKLGAEFDGGLIREIDTDETGYPVQEVILLVKGEENEENRTGINGFREVHTIKAISKENLKNFGVTPDFGDEIVSENNEYYFIGLNGDNEYFSELNIFDVEERY